MFVSKPLGLAPCLHLLCHLKTDIENITSQLLLHVDLVSDSKKPFVITDNCLGLVQGLLFCCTLLAEEQMDENAEATFFKEVKPVLACCIWDDIIRTICLFVASSAWIGVSPR